MVAVRGIFVFFGRIGGALCIWTEFAVIIRFVGSF
jgi:hypothetical protein